jgi:glycosyltransferase involved in cell wall biosynthesis
MKTLSLALIVKNEAQVLPRLLDTVTFADEIIICDTGSTDETVAIAEKYGAKVCHFDWCDDFAAARNYAFSQASGDYIMWLDADDIVLPADAEKIKVWKTKLDNIDTLMCKYVLSEDGSVWFYRERILRNCPLARWSGRIHEAITLFGNIVRCDVEIHHRPIAAHTARNVHIYRQMLKDGQQLNARETYYYARELYYSGFYTAALKLFRKFLRMKGSAIDIVEALKIMYFIYIKKKDTDKALWCAYESFKYGRMRADMCCVIADVYVGRGELQRAIDFYLTALICDNVEGFFNADSSKFVPYMQLCMCYSRLGDTKTAYQYHLLAEELKPTHPSVVHNKEYFAKVMGNVQ